MHQRRRHRQRDDLGPGAVLEPQVLDALPIFRERLIIDIALVRFLDQHHRVSVHEPANVIDVPVRVITHRTVQKPNHIFHTEIFPERLVVLLARKARVAHLNFRVQITFLSRQQGAAAV
jgi:hypothetical protein